MFWTSVQLMRAAGLEKYDLWYLRRRFPNKLVPALVAGSQYLWEPSTLALVQSLRRDLTARGRPRKDSVAAGPKGKP